MRNPFSRSERERRRADRDNRTDRYRDLRKREDLLRSGTSADHFVQVSAPGRLGIQGLEPAISVADELYRFAVVVLIETQRGGAEPTTSRARLDPPGLVRLPPGVDVVVGDVIRSVSKELIGHVNSVERIDTSTRVRSIPVLGPCNEQKTADLSYAPHVRISISEPEPASYGAPPPPLQSVSPSLWGERTESDGAPIRAMVSWSHGDPDFDDDQRAERQRGVLTFAEVLRRNGVGAWVDAYAPGGTDWTREGPRQMRNSDVVLGVSSIGWRLAWEGGGDPTKGAGAKGEADVLKGWHAKVQTEFQDRFRLVVLPGDTPEIPDDLHGVERYLLTGFDDGDFEPLLRDLTQQPRHVAVPLGSVPILPAADILTDRGPSQGAKGFETTYETSAGAISVAIPEIPPCSGRARIEEAIDDFVTDELRAFEGSENVVSALKIGSPFPAINNAWIRLTEKLCTQELLSFVAACDYNFPGAATSYQRKVGFTFRAADGERLGLRDISIDEPGELPSLLAAYLDAVKEFDAAATADGLPSEPTITLTSNSLGICTHRYDILPGMFGAPIIWIPHDKIGRLYRPEFTRRLVR